MEAEAQGGVAGLHDRGGDSADWGDDRVSEDEGKPEEGRSTVKPKGWRVERRLTEVCPDVRGSPEES